MPAFTNLNAQPEAVKTLVNREQIESATNHPAHYNTTRFEVDEWFPTNPLLWNVGKYIARANHKGKTLEDLKKARAYLDREIARLEKVSTVEKK